MTFFWENGGGGGVFQLFLIQDLYFISASPCFLLLIWGNNQKALHPELETGLFHHFVIFAINILGVGGYHSFFLS